MNLIYSRGGQKIPKVTKAKTTEQQSSVLKLKELITASLDGDKAEDIEVIDLKDQSSLADYMIIATGRSSRQVTALAENLVERASAQGIKHSRVEGVRNGDWVVVDMIDIIVHIFRPEVRVFYNIEKMWRSPLMDQVDTAAERTTQPV